MAESTDKTAVEDVTVYPLEAYRATLDFEYLTSINYSMAHNHCRTVVRCVISNDGDTPLRQVAIAVSGPMIVESMVRIDQVASHASIDVTDDIGIAIDTNALVQVTESIDTTITVTVTLGNEDGCRQVALSKTLDLRLMAYDQWMGLEVRPELVASFVTPNHPMLSAISVEASRLLNKWTGNGALDGYLSQDTNRVRMQVAAVYEALRARGIVYVTSPASYEKYGQRIRLVDKILNEKLANCIEASLLIASCLESVGIQPLLVFTTGHCMVGAWLLRDTYPKPCGDDGEFLIKCAADGLNEIVVFDGVAITSSESVTFDDAVAMAMPKLRNEFDLFVDVQRARLNGVRPLPMRVQDGDRWVVVNEGEDRDSATTSVRQYDRYDLTNYDTGDSKVTKYTIWERKLLDFSLRNNLLNMRMGRNIIPLVSYSIDKVEDAIQAHETFQVMPFPLDHAAKAGDKGLYDSTMYPELERLVVEDIARHRLYSFQNETELANALKNVYRASRTSLEENGANNLYMVFGLLRWYETDRSQQPHYAPILLMPIEIVRRGGALGYEIRMRDEEMILNITLVELLKQQHDVDLSGLDELPKDQSGVDVKLILSIVRDKIKSKKGWNVTDESVIGLFSFNKFVMWHDIHSNSALMRQNDIISSLVDGRLNVAPATAINIKAADSRVSPEGLTIPIDVDSSQLEAVIASGLGDSFILHGPPGTGKSQTITNMIANALAQGKRVLFVAEKMAALSVVQSRLERIGLAPFCLELHSNKVTKQHFLRQMQMALDVVKRNPPQYYAQESKTLFEKRRQLIAHVEALHKRKGGGYSLYDCITQYLTIDGAEMPVDINKIRVMDSHTFEQTMGEIADLDTVLRIIGNPSDYTLKGLRLIDGSYQAEEALRGLITELQRLIHTGYAPIELCYDRPRLTSTIATVDAAIEAEDCRQQIYARFGGRIRPEDLGMIIQEHAIVQAKWLVPRYFALNALRKRWGVTDMDIAFVKDVDMRLHDAERRATGAPQAVDKRALRAQLQTCNDISQILDQIGRYAIVEVGPQELPSAVDLWATGMDGFRNWYLWCRAITPLLDRGLGMVVDYITDKHISARATADAFAKGYFHSLARRIINSDEGLRYFDGALFEDTIQKYRTLTARFQQLSIEALCCKLAANIPDQTVVAHESSELGILKRNIKNGGRGMSIRKIIDLIPNLLPRLCPCMLMSPLSVAQYIDLKNEKFDIVIFDEASQMPTSEAVGAIARGRSLIVVGDPKQMPPTSFFATSAVGEDEAYIDDMESILDDCISLSIPSRYLSWHYRSKHESLIAFSNAQYYESRLTTFPSVDDQVSKVSLRYVDGVYDRSRTRSNIAEAQAVVDEVIRRLSDPELQRMSIGIVSFSKVQQDKIEDMLTDALAKDKKLESLAYDGAEPIFVKNLENVQGDERDVILFSVGYGPDKEGKVSMNFGPLNNAGGERRLNVAVSRSRYEMMVFSSLRPEQIDLRRTSALGVEGLKRFLEFAQSGRNVTGLSGVTATDDSIATQIASELAKHGYETRVNVGRSHFRVDVAVVDKEQPSRFRLGILCDGRNYYATQTVRDREVVQPSVLRMLGWDILRVWTLDWFERPQQVIEAILKRLAEGPTPPDDADKGTPTINQAVTIESQPAVSEAEASKAVPYETAQLPPLSMGSVLGRPTALNPVIRALVETEAPLTDTLLYKRIVKHLGVSRLTPNLKDAIDQRIEKLRVYTTPNAGTGCVFWRNAKQSRTYEEYRVESGREIMDIPVVEVANAMLHIIRQQISIDREALMRLTANALGFSRMGANITQATDLALRCLADAQMVTISGEKVAVKKL